jgi:hypothetical protein
MQRRRSKKKDLEGALGTGKEREVDAQKALLQQNSRMRSTPGFMWQDVMRRRPGRRTSGLGKNGGAEQKNKKG